MNTCFLALGSNLNAPERQIRLAIKHIQQLASCAVIAIAPFYPNEAIGRRAQPKFCNTVIKILTQLTPLELLDACQHIEALQGRVRRVRWGARPIDIDILYYADRQLKTPRLTIPHPLIQEREFVYKPLRLINS